VSSAAAPEPVADVRDLLPGFTRHGSSAADGPPTPDQAIPMSRGACRRLPRGGSLRQSRWKPQRQSRDEADFFALLPTRHRGATLMAAGALSRAVPDHPWSAHLAG
jgi:hypothetical protein